jgi:hypothetical protein
VLSWNVEVQYVESQNVKNSPPAGVRCFPQGVDEVSLDQVRLGLGRFGKVREIIDATL